MARSELGSRLMVAGIGIPLAIWLIYLGGWFLGGLMGLAGALSAAEYYGLARQKGGSPVVWLGVPAAGLMSLLATLHPTYAEFSQWAFAMVIAVGLGSVAAVLWIRWPEGRPLTDAATTTTGVIYTGVALAFSGLLHHLPTLGGSLEPWHGAAFVIFPLFVSWIGDAFAFFIGSRFGKEKLLEAVSPKKTWVGGIASLVGATVMAGVYGHFALSGVPEYGVSWQVAALMGIPISLVGQVGDLAESVLKREADVKDSSHLLPGHGGALDRMDGVFLTIPLTYGLLVLARYLG